MEWRHVLLTTHPVQGHINPSLQFTRLLLRLGIHVTFVTTLHAHRRMLRSGGARPTRGLTFAPYSDGHGDEGLKPNDDTNKYIEVMQRQSSTAMREIIATAAADGRPVTCLVYTIALPWAADVARELHVPNALLWIQPATLLNVYYYYFHDFGQEIAEKLKLAADHEWTVKMPGVPPLSKRDLPSLLLPSSPEIYRFLLSSFEDQFQTLDSEERPTVLVNTFDALEADAINAIGKYDVVGIGPLIPWGFIDCELDPSDNSIGGDLFQKPDDDDSIEWLNSKAEASVVYVSFGSLVNLSRAQMEEIGKGLVGCGRPFLWVIRRNEYGGDEELSCRWEEAAGKIVAWCSQMEVLKHRSVGCFVSHCGWNSTVESMSCGVPMVAFPQWTDQGTNAKLIEDVWGTGVRAMTGDGRDGAGAGDVESGELVRCIEEVMDGGDKSRQLRENAGKWKRLAREAMQENGSSNVNLKAFFSI